MSERLFAGPDYVPARDNARLLSQLGRIQALMEDGHWRTLREIAQATGAPEASVSAQLRHLRKARFGGWTVEKFHVEHGLYRYRLVLPAPAPQTELFVAS